MIVQSNHAISKNIVPWVVAIGLFMENLDSTIVSTAIPQMSLSFHVNPINLKVALTSYLLSLAVFIPISGWLADKFGTRRIFSLALLVFTLSSLLCGISDNLWQLVFARIFVSPLRFNLFCMFIRILRCIDYCVCVHMSECALFFPSLDL